MAPEPKTHKAFDADLDDLERRMQALGDLVVALVNSATECLEHFDASSVDEVVRADDPIDAAYIDLQSRAIELVARRQPVARDLRQIVAMLQTSLHLERVADCMVDAVQPLAEARSIESGESSMVARLAEMGTTVASMTVAALEAFRARDAQQAIAVEITDDTLDRQHDVVFEQIVGAPPTGVDLRWLFLVDRASRALERAGDHAVDIAEQVWYLVTGEFREFGHIAAEDATTP